MPDIDRLLEGLSVRAQALWMRKSHRFLSVLATFAILAAATDALAQTDPLPSWNDGHARRAIVEFVRATTDSSGANFVRPEERFATFDQDGTLWVSHPLYAQAMFALDRVHALAPKHPEWKTTPPFSAILANDKEAMAKLSLIHI